MSARHIEQLQPIKHEDVKPMYSKEEILDKLASAVHYLREAPSNAEQRLVIELIYSLAKALK